MEAPGYGLLNFNEVNLRILYTAGGFENRKKKKDLN